MKKSFIILLTCVAFIFVSCSVNTSGNVKSNGEDIQYVKDPRTGLCFAVVASRKTGNVESSGLGLTECDCGKVEHLIK